MMSSKCMRLSEEVRVACCWKEALRQVAANHKALDLVTAELVGCVVADLASILEDRQPVCDGADLGEVMRDESDNEALPFERLHRFENNIDLAMVEKRRRFVEQHSPRRCRQRACDLDAFPLPEIESGKRLRDRNLSRETVQQSLCGAVQPATPKQPVTAEAGEPPRENVLRNRQRRIDGDLLEDEAYAAPASPPSRISAHRAGHQEPSGPNPAARRRRVS